MKKGLLSLLCALSLLAALVVPAAAADSNAIQVQLNGQNLSFTDAVPTANGGRTYLPFRTVFEALGAKVDYDSAAGTVTAVRDGKMTMDVNGMGSKLLTGDIAIKGITSGNGAMQMAMDMKLDMTGLMALAAATGDSSQISTDYQKLNIQVDNRGKRSDGKIYFLMRGIPDIPEGVWFMLDMNKFMEQSGMGMDFASFLDLSKQMDQKALLSLALSTAPVDSVSAYTELTASLKGIATLLSDNSFRKTAEGYSNTVAFSANGSSFHMDIKLLTNASGEVTGMDFVMDMTMTDPSLAEQGMDSITIHMTSSQKGEKSSFQMTLDAGSQFDAKITVDMTVSPTTKTPEVTPPAGATVIDLFETAGLSF